MIGLGIGLILLVVGIYFFKNKVVSEIKKNLAVDEYNTAKAEAQTEQILKESKDFKGKDDE